MRSLGQTNLAYLYLLTVVVLVGTVWLWKVYIYQPLVQKEGTCIIAIEAIEHKKLLLPDLKYAILSLRNKSESLKIDLRSCLLRYAYHDPYLQLERILTDLDDVGLNVEAFVPQETKKKLFYDRDVIGFKVRGDFEKISDFLRLFNERNMLATFKKATISHDDEGLVLDSVVALYRVKEE